jgi:hypothetical protein
MTRIGALLLVGCVAGGCESGSPPPAGNTPGAPADNTSGASQVADDTQVADLARRVAAGDDLTGVGYGLAHGDDPSRAVRVYVAVGRYLLERLDSYSGAERQRVEAFVSDGGAGDPLPSFSPEAARQRLDRIEAQLGKGPPNP